MMSDRDLDALEDDLNNLDNEEDADDWRKYLRFAPMILAGGAFVLFSLIVLIAYWGDDEDEQPQQVVAPVLTPQTAIKIVPEEPGGLEIPDQDKLVYNELSQGADDGQVEQILPGAEEPKEPPKAATDTTKPSSGVAAIPAPGDAAVVPPPADGDTALLAEPQTPAPEAPEIPGGEKPATDTMKSPEKPADGDTVAAAQVPGVIPDQPQTPAPEGGEPTAQTPILNGPKAPATDKPSTDQAMAVKPPTEKSRPVTTTQMRTLAGVYRIQIASLRSPKLAEREWSSQVKKNPDLLSKLSLTVQRAVIKNNGTYYRVQAGPIRDRESADTLCQNLRSRGQDCIVVRP